MVISINYYIFIAESYGFGLGS